MNTQSRSQDPRLYSIKDYEALAKTRLHKYARDYYNLGANDMISLKSQADAFDKIKLKTRTFAEAG